MATTKINGIILSESNMGDYDKMLTMLTPNFGKISCSAKGARKPNSSLLAGTQMFCFGEYLMYKGTSTYHINSCETIEMFYKIRTDLDKLKYAIYVDKIVMDVPEENENDLEAVKKAGERDENLAALLPKKREDELSALVAGEGTLSEALLVPLSVKECIFMICRLQQMNEQAEMPDYNEKGQLLYDAVVEKLKMSSSLYILFRSLPLQKQNHRRRTDDNCS